MSTLITLYPPIMQSYMPAFIYNTNIKVYFTLSEFNSLDEIKNAQITIVNQNTNLTVLDKTKYPSEIMLKNIQTDSKGYYIEIAATDITGGAFEIDTYYNLQIRFTSDDAADPPSEANAGLDAWLAANLDYFSEWSRVCILYAISQPTLTISGFDIQDGHIYWSMANSNLIGTLTFSSEDEKEILKSYRVKLYDSNNILLTDSGDLYSDNYNNPNSFIYNFKYGFVVGESYSFAVTYETNNLYNNNDLPVTMFFEVIQDSSSEIDFSFATKLDENNARVKLEIKKSEDKPSYTGKLIIRRTSSESNFTIWEDIHVINLSNVLKYKYIWYDNTIKSGVWYNYALQEATAAGIREGIKILKKPIITIFDDVYLSTKDKQLKVRFNPSINSFKRNISETKIETIGSKYPFIRRNNSINYAEFPISGLISFQMDEDNLFAIKEELYLNKQIAKKYNGYNTETLEDWPITEANDFVYEKLFRDRVMDFLMDSKVKLFRSSTEGNILVRLNNISFTPNEQLGRMIWSFSATATEIDEDTVDNYDLYGIIEERGI